ncbi:MAG: pyroglutamyl-peptidase I [Bacillota bacterium]
MLALVSGFQPFGGDAVNPAREAMLALRGRRFGPWEVAGLELPVVFAQAGELLIEALPAHRPQLLIMLGLSSGRPELSVERLAVNLADAFIPDNAGAKPQDAPVVPGGPAAYLSTAPTRRMAAAIQAAGVPARLSYTAGTYVCNYVYYLALHHLAVTGSDLPAVFIHVPPLPAQVVDKRGQPSMALPTIVAGVEAALLAVG